jgi:Protein of unknown function (DUF3105)
MLKAAPRSCIGLLLCVGLVAQGCAGDDAGPNPGGGVAGSSPDGGGGSQLLDGATDDSAIATGAGACNVVMRAHPQAAGTHVPQPLPASAYNSRPPSSGSHCPVWGHYGAYTEASPLPACNFVHNLEHGAVVVLYHCPDGCDDIVSALQGAIDAAGPDPDCAQSGGKRIVLTPYADMDTKVAASAWGYTFTADCLDDAASSALTTFIQAHWGSRGDAPESSVCANGS